MEIRTNEPLKLHTTFRVGGECKRFILADREEGCEVIRECRAKKEPFFLIGKGSNLLVSDKGFPGTVLSFLPEDPVLIDQDRIRVPAGTTLAAAASFAADHGLSGLECLHGIPGTMGGAAVMNAGAYGSELKDIFLEGEVLTREGEIRTVGAEEMDFAYRSSSLEREGSILLNAVLKLEKKDETEIRDRMKELSARRKEKQPLDLPSAGSTFRRPEGYYAGKLIEEAGMKGFSIGGAAVSEKHAGFIVNWNNATAEEIYRLIRRVQEEVYRTSKVELVCEVKMLGEF